MPTRAQNYGYTFMAGLALPALYEQVVRDYANLEQRREYVQGLIAQENQQIANLEQVFAAKPVDSAALQAQLEVLESKGVSASEILSSQGGAMSADQRRAFRNSVIGNPDGAAQALRSGQGGLTKAQFNTRLDLYAKALRDSNVPASQVNSRVSEIRTSRQRLADNDAVPFGSVGLSREQRESITDTESNIASMVRRGPEGIRGGVEGEEEGARRKNTAAPEGTGFGTEEDAFNAAVASVSDGAMSVEDFGGNAEAFALAERVYNEAKAKGAYRNDQRASFETSMLTARARLQQLEQQAQSLARPEGLTRDQELARKQAEARGYDFSKPYVRLQKSRYYSNIVRGDELFNSALEASARLAAEDPDRFTTPQGMGSIVLPTNRAQTLARDYIAQRWASGDESLSMRQAERQFNKVLRGDDLQEALSFAVAFHKGLKKNVMNPTDAERQMQAQREAAEQREQRRQDALRAQRTAQEAALLTQQMEAEQVASVSGMRDEQQAAPQAAANLYNRMLLKGLRGREINQKLNEGFEIITTTGITEETRGRLLEEAGLSQPDAASLAVAFSPQIRDIVRNSSIDELAELAENPVFAENVRREQEQRSVRADFAEIAQTPPAGGIGLPAAASPRGVRVLEETQRRAPGPIEPGETQNPDILLEEDALLERQRREANEPPPRVPSRQRSDNIAPITQQQLAVFEAMDDATLEVLRDTGSVYAGNVLAARTAPQGTPEQEVVLEPEPEPEPQAAPPRQPRTSRAATPPASQQTPEESRRQANAPAAAAATAASVQGGVGLPGSRAAASTPAPAQPTTPAAPAADPLAGVSAEARAVLERMGDGQGGYDMSQFTAASRAANLNRQQRRAVREEIEPFFSGAN